jgi:3-oxoacyl-[acyl-carrier-protein] synthase-3
VQPHASKSIVPPTRPLRPVRIAGLSTYVPPRVMTNADLEKLVDTTDEWILQRTGIRERHVVDPGVATSDLAYEAALGAIKQAGIDATDIGFIVVGTTTPDTIFPSTACLLQNKLGATNAWGFDLGAACSGFTYSLTVGMQMVASGAVEHALVIGADVMSSILDYTDRSTCILFGDGAGAVVCRQRRMASPRSSTSRRRSMGAAARRSTCRPAAAVCRRHTRPSTSICTS